MLFIAYDYDKIQISARRKKNNSYQEILAKLQTNLDSFDMRYENMLFRLSNDEISQMDFNVFKITMEKKQKEIRQQISSLKDKIADEHKDKALHQEWVERFCEVKDIASLNRQIVVNLIERIELFEDKSIKITFRFRNPFEDI